MVALETVATARAGESVLYLLRVRSYAHLQRLGLDYYERELSGRIMTRMTTDVDALSTFLQTGLAQAIVSVLTVVGVTVALLVTDAGAGAGRAGRAAAAHRGHGGVPAAVRAGPTPTRARRSASSTPTCRRTCPGVRVAQAYVREERSATAFGERSAAYRRSRLRAQRYIALFFPAVTLLSDIATAAVLGVGAARLATGDLSAGVLTAFLLYLAMFFTPIQQLSQVFDGYQQARVGLSRITELLRTPTTVPPEPEGEPVAVPARLRGEVQIADVSFAYAGAAEPALTDVRPARRAGRDDRARRGHGRGQVHAGQAARPLLRRRFGRGARRRRGRAAVPRSPTTAIGSASCRRRRTCSPATWPPTSPTPAPTPHRPRSRPRPGRSAHRSWSAACPGGFRHPVGERGQGLSAGQRQLIALARAELADPDLLLFDEATAALDPATEAAVLAAGDRVTARRTAFVVAHRLTTAARADRIAVLEAGRIVELGTHAELLAAGGVYAGLWAAGELEPAA